MKFSASHSQQGWCELQWGRPRVLEKYSWSPMMLHTTPLKPWWSGFPFIGKKTQPFSKGTPSGSKVGCLPHANASKLQPRCFQISCHVSFFPQDLGKHASSQWLSKVGRLDAKHPQLKTNKLSLLEYSTPSPWTNRGMVVFSQSFSKDMGWFFSLASPDLATSFQKLATVPFPKPKSLRTLLGNFGPMQQTSCEVEKWMPFPKHPCLS